MVDLPPPPPLPPDDDDDDDDGCNVPVAAAPQVSAAEQLFREMDADGSGLLDKGEVQRLCKKMGHKLSKKGLKMAMAEMDANGSGEVDFEEFDAWWFANAGGEALKKFPPSAVADSDESSDESDAPGVASSLPPPPPPPPGGPLPGAASPANTASPPSVAAPTRSEAGLDSPEPPRRVGKFAAPQPPVDRHAMLRATTEDDLSRRRGWRGRRAGVSGEEAAQMASHAAAGAPAAATADGGHRKHRKHRHRRHGEKHRHSHRKKGRSRRRRSRPPSESESDASSCDGGGGCSGDDSYGSDRERRRRSSSLDRHGSSSGRRSHQRGRRVAAHDGDQSWLWQKELADWDRWMGAQPGGLRRHLHQARPSLPAERRPPVAWGGVAGPPAVGKRTWPQPTGPLAEFRAELETQSLDSWDNGGGGGGGGGGGRALGELWDASRQRAAAMEPVLPWSHDEPEVPVAHEAEHEHWQSMAVIVEAGDVRQLSTLNKLLRRGWRVDSCTACASGSQLAWMLLLCRPATRITVERLNEY
jgi:hypothetical protein